MSASPLIVKGIGFRIRFDRKVKRVRMRYSIKHMKGLNISSSENSSLFDMASLDDLDDGAKLAMLAPLVTAENIYDGSETSR
jgi:hypothetical protein